MTDKPEAVGPGEMALAGYVPRAELEKSTLELQQLYEAFRPQNSPKNPREVAQFVQQYRMDAEEKAALEASCCGFAASCCGFAYCPHLSQATKASTARSPSPNTACGQPLTARMSPTASLP